MKNKEKYIKRISLLWICVIGMFLTGCSDKTVSESEIKENFIEENSIFQEYEGFEITDFEIVERRTDSKGGTDYVELNVKAEKMPITYTANCILNYKLFDQGWVVESLEIVEEEFYADTEYEYLDIEQIDFVKGKSYIRTPGIVKQDLVNTRLQFIYFEDLEVTNFNIYSRDCNLRENRESIHCEIEALSDSVRYWGEYVLSYEREENGEWYIVNEETIGETTTPLKGEYTWETVDTYLEDIMAQTGQTNLTPYYESLNIEEGTHFFYYATPEIYEMQNTYWRTCVCVKIEFTSLGWKVDDNYTMVGVAE